MNREVIFLKGLPASGKSTWAKQFCIDNPNYIRLNKDDIREELGNPAWSKQFENIVLEKQREAGKLWISMNKSLIIDDTNFAKIHHDFWLKIASDNGYDFTVKTFDADVNTCVERDKNREKPVGEGVIRGMYKRYLKPSILKTDNRFILNQNPRLCECIICDIDGTLALMTGRSPFDDTKIHTDKLNNEVAQILRDYWMNDMYIIIMSGRQDKCRKETEEWLDNNGIPYDSLYMRETGDFRPDEIIKEEIYNEHIKNQYYVKFVLDDRNKVVDMWRKLGLLCLQVYYGEF